jgi:hypothetical protein
LGGVIITVWCLMRIQSKDVQRTIFQPVNFAAMTLNVISLSRAGSLAQRSDCTCSGLCRYSPGCRAVERAQAQWKAQRRRVPQGDPAAAAGIGTGPDRAAAAALAHNPGEACPRT